MSSTVRLDQAQNGRRTTRRRCAWALLSVLCAACGGSVTVSQSGGTTGAGASSSATGTGAGGVPSGTGGAATGATTNATSTASSASTTSSSGAGGGSMCGGLAGFTCPSGQYCDYPSKDCGGDDDTGTCAPRPQACPNDYQPTCGCDLHVYANACEANAAGVDVDDLGGCTPPAGMFGCGAGFCHLGAEYCEFDASDVATIPSTYTCKPLPAGCGTAPGCACLSNVQCGTLCMSTANGGIQVTCPGG